MVKKAGVAASFMPHSLNVQSEREKYIAELKKNPNKYPLSKNEGYECCGLPCACLACKHEDSFCIDFDTGPCSACSGRLEEIVTEFCIPDDTTDCVAEDY